MISTLESDLAAGAAALADLEAAREAAIFEGGDAAVEKASKALTAHRERMETLQAALAGAKRRHAQAVEDEAAAAREARKMALKAELQKIAAKHCTPCIAAFKRYEQLAAEMSAALAEIAKHQPIIDEANAKASAAGYPEFCIADLDSQARERLDAMAREAGCAFIPNSLERLTEGVSLPGHWPRDKYALGSPYAKL